MDSKIKFLIWITTWYKYISQLHLDKRSAIMLQLPVFLFEVVLSGNRRSKNLECLLQEICFLSYDYSRCYTETISSDAKSSKHTNTCTFLHIKK